jgi:signal transduction histidine kinase
MYLVNSGLKKDNSKRLNQGWEMVKRNVDRIRGTVLNILYYAKERELTSAELSAGDLVEEVYSVIAPKAEEHGITLAMDVDASAGKFQGDHLSLRSLLVNLMENSLDACRVDRKKEDHHVDLSAKGDDKEVVFEVSDNGIGMDRETREKVFTLFFSSKGMEGTGLGLFIANNIAAAHGGGIDVESEVDKGSHFTIRISRDQAFEEKGLTVEPNQELL